MTVQDCRMLGRVRDFDQHMNVRETSPYFPKCPKSAQVRKRGLLVFARRVELNFSPVWQRVEVRMRVHRHVPPYLIIAARR